MICSLLGEGPSDRVLLPILRWLLEQNASNEFRMAWVDTSLFRTGPALADKVRGALVVQPCDLLFVHRDADNQPPAWRVDEIRDAAGELQRLEADTRAALTALGRPLHDPQS